jgi:hypothetical protein
MGHGWGGSMMRAGVSTTLTMDGKLTDSVDSMMVKRQKVVERS